MPSNKPVEPTAGSLSTWLLKVVIQFLQRRATVIPPWLTCGVRCFAHVKLSAYIVRFDNGFCPNPFGRYCTLACCKPTVRRRANVGDVILGSGSAGSGLSGKLIYAMRVREVVPYQTYWERYPSKRPSPRTPISKRGDNIWHRDRSGVWRGVRGALHDDRHRDRDLRGENALVSSEFYYFGRDAIPVPEEFVSMLATTQGHRNTHDEALITRFWHWLSHTAPSGGRISSPSEFTETACRCQRTEEEPDDVCEND